MSSHHIVRDKQEPALFILAYDQFPFEELGNLLEWSPTVICNETTFEKITSLGIKVDVVLLNTSNAIKQNVLEDQYPLDVHCVVSENQVAFILKWLIESKYTAITILTASGNMMSLIDQLLPFTEKIQLVLVDNLKRHLIYTRHDFQKWMPENSHMSLTPIQKNGKIRISGGGIDLQDDFRKSIDIQSLISDKITIYSKFTPYIISLPHK